MRWLKALTLALLALACGPTPPPHTPAPVDAVSVCEHLCDIHCDALCDPDCERVLSLVIVDRVLHVDVACVMDADTAHEADSCAGVSCQ